MDGPVRNIGVIFAGGVGIRMKSPGIPKQFLELNGKPIIVHTLECFENHNEIDAIAVAILPEWRSHLEKLAKQYMLSKVEWIVDGGATGQDSRYAALHAIEGCVSHDSIVLMHDGVRPFVSRDTISSNIHDVREYGSSVTCTQMVETPVLCVDANIQRVLDRNQLYVARAPQAFYLKDLLFVYDDAMRSGIHDSLDSASLMLRSGFAVHATLGPVENIKITTPEDYYVGRAFFSMRESRLIEGQR